MPNYTPFDSLQDMLADVSLLPRECSATTDEMKLNQYSACTKTNNKQQTLVVKQFTANSYNGPKIDDCINRLAIIFDAAKAILDEDEASAEANELLAAARQMADDELRSKCRMNPVPLNQLATPLQEDQLVDEIKRAKGILQCFVVRAIAAFAPEAMADEKQLEKARLRLIKKESQITLERGSPNFINFYELNGVKRVSAARVVAHAIPSTERRGEPWGKLPNFKQTSMGHLNADGEYVPELDVYRHSSYVPFKIKNTWKREQATLAMVENMLAELAESARKRGEREPLTLKLSTLSLLSPMYFDQWYMWDESEYRQLHECHEALMMVNGQTFYVQLAHGQRVEVKPQINMINAPVNPHGIYFKNSWFFWTELENNINCAGVLEFMQTTQRDLKNEGVTLSDFQLQGLDGLAIKKQELAKAYGAVREALKASDKHSYQQAKKTVKLLKKDINREEKEVMKALKKRWTECRPRFASYLNKLEQESPRQEKVILYNQTLAMLLDGQVEPSQWGARFVLLRRLMGDQVDFFCKSGEDRTGRFNNLLEELCEFKRHQKRYPRYNVETMSIDQSDVLKQSSIAQTVSEFSISRDINDQNAHGARGLQIGTGTFFRTVLNLGLPNKSGDALGKLAKDAYKTIDLNKLRHWLSLGMTNSKKKMLDVALQPIASNRLLEENLAADVAGFKTRLVKAGQDFFAGGLTSLSNVVNVKMKSRIRPTYRGVRLNNGDCLVAEKWCALVRENSRVLGHLEHDAEGSVSDKTQVPEGEKLAVDESIALAMQQATMFLRPPFSVKSGPAILEGGDPEQVARAHAALLFLKRSHPSLNNLVIVVKGNSLRPGRARHWPSQAALDRDFIKQQLGNVFDKDSELALQKAELGQLIKQQHVMKSLFKPERQEGSLKIMPGQRLKP